MKEPLIKKPAPALILILAFLFFPVGASSSNKPMSVRCVGDVSTQKSWTEVLIKKTNRSYTVQYSKLSNKPSKLEKLFGSDNFIVFGLFSESGWAVWAINKKILKFAYMQTKDISKVIPTIGFNQDNYLGRCSVVEGDIENF